jgi:hypothetical protein
MIPSTNGFLAQDFVIEEQPSKTYKMHLDESIILGYADKLDAMVQVIFSILNTERYQYVIYSWNYGIELVDLYGQPVSYVIPELKRRITEALTWDERIISVDNFDFSVNKRKITCNFTVHTIFGDIQTEKVVNF